MNTNIPIQYAYCHGIDTENNIHDCVIHAVRSRSGKIMTFHVLLECGAHYSLLPLNKITHEEKVLYPLPLSELQRWDCFSDQVESIVFDHFRFKRVKLIKYDMWGEYICTFDWMDNSYSDYPPEFKQGHFIKLENGQYGIYPNNCLLFEDLTFTGESFGKDIPNICRQTEKDYLSVERI